MSFYEPNANGSNSIYDANGGYNYATYNSFVDLNSHAEWSLQTTTTQYGFNGRYMDGTWTYQKTGYLVNQRPEFVSNHQQNCWKIIESIKKSTESLYENSRKSQEELDEYFQKRKEKLDEDWRKYEEESMERRRKAEEDYRARQNAYMISMVSHPPHPFIQHDEKIFSSVVEDKVGPEAPRLAELKIEPKIGHSSAFEEVDNHVVEYGDQLVEEIEHFDMIVGDKADQEKSQSTKFEVKAEACDSETCPKVEMLAYIVAKNQEHTTRVLSMMLHGLQKLEPNAENKETYEFELKHRWPPP